MTQPRSNEGEDETHAVNPDVEDLDRVLGPYSLALRSTLTPRLRLTPTRSCPMPDARRGWGSVELGFVNVS